MIRLPTFRTGAAISILAACVVSGAAITTASPATAHNALMEIALFVGLFLFGALVLAVELVCPVSSVISPGISCASGRRNLQPWTLPMSALAKHRTALGFKVNNLGRWTGNLTMLEYNSRSYDRTTALPPIVRQGALRLFWPIKPGVVAPGFVLLGFQS